MKSICAIVCVFIVEILCHKIQHVEEKPSHRLQQDIMDFISLIPFGDIRNLTKLHYHHDEEVRDAFDYVSTEDYTEIKMELIHLKEVKDFRNYLRRIGFDFEAILKKLKDEFKPEEIMTSSEENTSANGRKNLLKKPLYVLKSHSCINA